MKEYSAWICMYASGDGVYRTFERAGGMLCGRAKFISEFESRLWRIETDSRGRILPGASWVKIRQTNVECSSAVKKTLTKVTRRCAG